MRWLVLLLFGALLALPNEPAAAATTTVTLKDLKFNPAGVTVAPGDTVVWENEDDTAHSVNFDDDSFDSHPDCVQQPILGPVDCMDPGDTAKHNFDQPGEYTYRCKIHGSMVGTVVVQAAEVTTTTTAAPVTTQPPTTVTTASTTTTTRKLATSSTLPPTTTSTAPAETSTTLTPNEAPTFDPGDGDDETGAAVGSGGDGDDSGSGTVALIVAALLAVAGGGGLLLWRLRPRAAQP